MFNHPTLLYHCYKDAERESRRNPNNDNGGGGCLVVIGIIFMICLWQAAFQTGGFAIVIALAATAGLIGGMFQNK